MVSGSGDLAMTPPLQAPQGTLGGTLRLTGPVTLTGRLTVNTYGGTLSIAGNATAPNAISERINNGGTLEIDDNLGGNLADRLPDTSPVYLDGGTLSLVGVDGGSSAETLGMLTPEFSGSTINVTPGVGGTAVLTFGGLTRTLGAKLNVTGTGLGTSSRVMLLNQSATDFHSWLLVNGGPAKYDPLYGVVAQGFVAPPQLESVAAAGNDPAERSPSIQTGGATTPEPSCLTVVVFAAAGLLQRRPRTAACHGGPRNR
jgi:hypothetical protein